MVYVYKLWRKEKRHMNVLFIIEDGERSTFFLANIVTEQKIKLSRIAPTYQMQGSSLVSFFLTDSRDVFLKRFSECFKEVSVYLVVNQEVILQACFYKRTTCCLSNYASFTRMIQDSPFMYEKGSLNLDRVHLREFFKFVEEKNMARVFDRQEQVIKVLKTNLFNGKTTWEIGQVVRTFYSEVETNLTLKKGVELFFSYQKKWEKKIERIDFY